MRYPENNLTIDQTQDGGWRLYGYWHGKRIRFQHRFRECVDDKRKEIEQSAVPLDQRRHLQSTWMTAAQVRDAEAATLRAGGRSLLECVEAADKVMVSSDPVPLAVARNEWVADLGQRRRFPRTIEKNRQRVAQFMASLPAAVQHVGDITPDHVNAYVFRTEGADYTRLTDAQVVRAWLNFCVRKRWLKVSPFAIDTDDMQSRARPKERPRIPSVDDCWAILRAAQEHTAKDGRKGTLVPYAILAVWCFMRHGEAARCTFDWLKLDAKVPVVEVDPRKRGTPSYRTVTIPANVLPLLRDAVKRGVIPAGGTVPWTREQWLTIRARAGVIKLGKKRNGRRPIVGGDWPENYLRHGGISYFYQKTGDLKETVRQAGNSDDTAFRHYLNLPAEGACDAFYGGQPVITGAK